MLLLISTIKYLILFFPDYSCKCSLCGFKILEAQHVLCSPLNKSIVHFYPGIKVITLPGLDPLNASFIINSEGFFVLFTLINVDPLGTTILTISLQQKLLDGVLVSSFSE